MNRLDFHSVATLLQKHLIESADMTQIVFISTIFSCFVNETDFSFDEGLCCKWMKGQARISPKIVSFYQFPQNKEEMYGDIEEELFLQISDIGALGEDLYNLLIADTSVSELQRNKLLAFYDSSDIGKIAIFVSELLIFAIGRPFIKANLKTASTSPSIEDIIITSTLPKPVRTYVEVTGTLEAIHESLTNENILFIRGIPGIGKSELAKAYCRQYRKDYTNVLFLQYTGCFYEMIADLDFVDDANSLTEKERFRRHFRFLKTLQRDSLIVIDNFDNSDELLPQICDLKCNTIFTTQSNFSSYPQYEVIANKQQSAEIFDAHCTDHSLYTDEEMHELIEAVNYHAMTTELLARLISYSGIAPSTLLNQLKENVLLQQDTSKIPLTKDARNYKHPYYKHMENLIDLQHVSSEAQTILELIALAPESGFPLKLLYQWHKPSINEVNELEEIGLLTSRNQLLTIHPYVRKLINVKQLLCLSQADSFYKNIISCLSDETGNHTPFALSVMNTTLHFVKKDVPPLWKTLITHTLEVSKRLHQYRLFQDMLSEYEACCHLYDNITNDDRALLFHYKATEYAFIYQNYNKAAQFEERAIAEACGTGTSKIFNLSSFYVDAGNYYAKLGNTEKALANLQKGAGILTTTKTHFTQYGIYVLSTYAKFLYECNKPAEAIPILIRCVNIYDKLYDTDTLTKGYLYQNLAAMLASIGERQKALLYYSQAQSILKKYFDSEHPDIQICQEQEQAILSQKPSKPVLLDNEEVA